MPSQLKYDAVGPNVIIEVASSISDKNEQPQAVFRICVTDDVSATSFEIGNLEAAEQTIAQLTDAISKHKAYIQLVNPSSEAGKGFAVGPGR